MENTEKEHMDIVGNTDNPEEDADLERAANMNWTSETRLKMKEAGLYNWHPSSAPILKAFTNFLTHTLGVTRYKQETIFCYLKYVRRFVNFQIDNTNLFSTDPSIHTTLPAITLSKPRCPSKKAQYASLTHTMKTPQECSKLLSTAKGTFLTALDAAKKDMIDDHVKFEIAHYLEALLVLKHLQRPGVVQNMTIHLIVIGVAEHKTATQQVAAFALTEEKETWFDVYYRHVRPRLTSFSYNQLGRNFIVFQMTCGDTTKGTTFQMCAVRMCGECETFTVSQYTDSKRHLFAKYLAHPNATTERSYREKTLEDICHAYLLVSGAGASSSHESQAGTSSLVTTEVVPPEPAVENSELNFPLETDLSHAVSIASVSPETSICLEEEQQKIWKTQKKNTWTLLATLTTQRKIQT
ncbi:hypothetical protein XELAEV_18040586mg [Xenopus laevis]|uniref:Uncharacterized protein n=1 Tax=Xenopus laevis TaxID=8355 RepID=A0A974H975_XENLA|nr:hypothetical protein XELAEV_18040586mg [Xenopus laevis]